MEILNKINPSVSNYHTTYDFSKTPIIDLKIANGDAKHKSGFPIEQKGINEK